MIATLTGTVKFKQADIALIEVNGVGYQVLMPTTDLAALPPLGEHVTVYTHLYLKDDSLQLYGFNSQEKKGLFLNLISVSSVGPKLALAILSHLNVAQIKQAIISSNAGLIAATPGVGKKTAERLILELKDKLGLTGAEELPADVPLAEAQAALVSLGYTPLEAGQTLASLDKMPTAAAYIREALKRLAAK